MQNTLLPFAKAACRGKVRATLGGTALGAALLFAPIVTEAGAQPAPRCPGNYVFTGSTCERVLTKRPTCPPGWRFSRGACVSTGGGGTVAGGGCRYRGERGYDQPKGNTCRASYRFTARELANTDIVFNSDGRRWRFGETRSGWDLLSVSPPTKFGTTGNMRPTGNGSFSGTFSSGFCGQGWIDLTLIPGSC